MCKDGVSLVSAELLCPARHWQLERTATEGCSKRLREPKEAMLARQAAMRALGRGRGYAFMARATSGSHAEDSLPSTRTNERIYLV
jgi:hypothetical protein